MMGDTKHEARAVFTAALALNTPEERDRYLDEACRGKSELRQRVEALLRANDQASGFLEQTVPLAPTSDFEVERAGVTIGRYKLLEEIGEGGFGRVFMAEQKEPVHRKVALKIIKAGMDTKEVIARFEAERQALALMDHPNIAQVFDGGVTQAGRPYFVMELVRGISITEFCDQRDLSTDERLQLFIQVSHAVQHAHQKGIIHRDLKPSNMLVTLVNGEPLPKIIDFGVAKALGQQLTDKTLFTGFLRMVGTPAYMSPEQADLSGVDVDTRADIYALGVLLYELLTGVTPFDAETLHNAALDEVRRMIRETDPPKPSTRLHSMGEKLTEVAKHRQAEPAALSRLVRGDLDRIVMKCLEKDRRRRYETPGALVEDIQRHLDHQPVLASPPSAAYRTRKFIRRHRTGVALAASVTVALVSGLIVSLIGFAEARRGRDRAVAAEARAEQSRQRAEVERDRAVTAEANAEEERNHSEQLAAEAALDRGQSKLEAGDSWGLLDMVNAFDLAKRNPVLQKAVGHRWSTWHTLWSQRTIAERSMRTTPNPDFLQFVSISAWPPANDSNEVGLYDTLTGTRVGAPMMHESVAVACAFSPDGRLLATVTKQGVIHLWDCQTGTAIRPPCETGVAELNQISFSPDGRYLIAFSLWNSGQLATKVGFLRVGDVQEPVHLLEHRYPVGNAQFSFDGELLAISGWPELQFWRTWDLTKLGTPFRAAPGNEFSVDGTRMAFAPGGTTSVALLDTTTMQIVRTLPKKAAQATRFGFSHDGRLLASYDWDCNLELWKTESGDGPYAAHRIGVRDSGPFAFNPDDSLLACGDNAGTVHVLRTSDGQIVHTLHTPSGPRPAFLGNGVLAACAGGRVHFWDLTASPLPELALPDDFLAHVLEFDGSGQFLAVGSEGELRLWTMHPSPRLERIIPMPGCVIALTWLKEEKQFMAFSDDGSLTRMDPRAVRTDSAGNVGRGFGLAASLSPDGRALVWFNRQWPFKQRSEDRYQAHVFDTRTGESKSIGLTLSAAFRPDSQRLARGTAEWKVQLYDPRAPTNSPLKRVGFPGWVEGVAYSPDGNLLAVCVMGNTLHLYDDRRNRRIGIVRRTSVQANLARFSADGSLLAVAGPLRDGGHAVELWHVDPELGFFASGVRLRREQPIWSIAFSPDDEALIVGGLGSTRLWRLPPQPKDLEEVQSQTWKTLGFRMEENGKRVYLDPSTNGVEELRTRLTRDPESSDTPLDAALKLPADEALTAVQELADQHPGITLYQQLLGHLHADVANSLANSAIALRTQGKLNELEEVCRELVGRDDAGALNNLAWLFATSSDPNQRDGRWAVKLAERAVAATGRTNAMYLDTLAAAYAEVGRFTNAVRVQKQAIALLEDPKEKEDYESRLRLLQSNSPYHQP